MTLLIISSWTSVHPNWFWKKETLLGFLKTNPETRKSDHWPVRTFTKLNLRVLLAGLPGWKEKHRGPMKKVHMFNINCMWSTKHDTIQDWPFIYDAKATTWMIHSPWYMIHYLSFVSMQWSTIHYSSLVIENPQAMIRKLWSIKHDPRLIHKAWSTKTWINDPSMHDVTYQARENVGFFYSGIKTPMIVLTNKGGLIPS